MPVSKALRFLFSVFLFKLYPACLFAYEADTRPCRRHPSFWWSWGFEPRNQFKFDGNLALARARDNAELFS